MPKTKVPNTVLRIMREKFDIRLEAVQQTDKHVDHAELYQNLPFYEGQYKLLTSIEVNLNTGFCFALGSLPETLCQGHFSEQRISPGFFRPELAGHALATFYQLNGTLCSGDGFTLDGITDGKFTQPLSWGEEASIYVKVMDTDAKNIKKAAFVITATRMIKIKELYKERYADVAYGIMTGEIHPSKPLSEGPGRT